MFQRIPLGPLAPATALIRRPSDPTVALLSIVKIVLTCTLVSLCLVAAVWVWMDLRRRHRGRLLLVLAPLLPLFVPLLGLFIYLLIRPPQYLRERDRRRLVLQALEK